MVIVLSLGFGGALAGVHVSLSDRIRLNQLNETLSQVPQLVPGAAGGEAFGEAGGRPVFKALDNSGQTRGYVIQARGQGFADVIQVLIGVDAEARRITGLYVLEQKETPGLGNKITEPAWCAQFKDKPEQVREKIVEGKLGTFYQRVCLMEQPFIKAPETTVGQLIEGAIAKFKENIQVRRFKRFELGKDEE
jgi:electron transport complex protein RnfG